jgi:CheY-like chemotaxis protein
MTPTARILIVDDEALLLKALGRVLRSRGYSVEVAMSGEEALEKLATFHPDLVLADYRMNGMLGTELREKVRHLAPGAVRVLIGATFPFDPTRPSPESAQTAIEHFMGKPWTNEVLLAEISHLLRRRRRVVTVLLSSAFMGVSPCAGGVAHGRHPEAVRVTGV